jgi:type 1 glutamine amidotransferase
MSSLLKKMLMVSVVLCVVGMFCNASFAVSEDEAAMIEKAAPDKAVATPKKARKMLIFTKCNGSVHSSIPYVTKALEVMGKKTGAYETVVSDDMSVFSAENLAQFDAICFNNTTALKPDEQQQKAILDFINNGKGIVGIHAATDNFYDWPAGGELMGGFFSGHPWHSGGTWAFKLDDPSHPLNASFEGKGFSLSDEIYLIREVGLRDTARILISLDYSDEATRTVKDAKPEYKDDPISWVKSVGKGRLFYCSFGHNHHILWNSAILKHYLAGIQFALGDNDVDTTPTNLKTCKLDSILGNVVKYDYGQSRETLTDLADFVRKSYPYIKLRREVEQKLIGALINKDATFAAKQFICRQLRLIGSDISVPILAKMLVDDKTSDIARYALEPIEGALVDKTLLDAIDKTSGKTKTGIINTIGVRADAKAVSKLSGFVNDSNKLIASASITALAIITLALASASALSFLPFSTIISLS